MSKTGSRRTGRSSAYEKAQAVKRAHQDDLMAKAHVVGVGIGLRQRGESHTDEVALVVMVTHKVAVEDLAPEDIVPTEIDGVPVEVQEVGEIKAL